MSRTTGTDWERLKNMTNEESWTNAISDPDNQPNSFGPRIPLRKEDGETLLQRFRKACEREKKIPVTVRYDADVLLWYKAKGKGYQSIMNAALRSVMEAEKAAMA